MTGSRHPPRGKMDYGAELQIMLTTDRNNSGDVCLLTESPYRILRVSDKTNIIFLNTIRQYNFLQYNTIKRNVNKISIRKLFYFKYQV